MDGSTTDLVGGWYDGSALVKYNFPLAGITTNLAWSALEFQQGYESAGEWDNVKRTLRWSYDYMLKCTPVTGLLYAQVGSSSADGTEWTRPEDMLQGRQADVLNATKNEWGSDIASEFAAAFAAGATVFAAEDKAYSDVLLARALSLFNTTISRGTHTSYDILVRDASGAYPNELVYDEISWAGAWLSVACGQIVCSGYSNQICRNGKPCANYFLEQAKGFFSNNQLDIKHMQPFNYGCKSAGVALLIGQLDVDNKWHEYLQKYFRAWAKGENTGGGFSPASMSTGGLAFHTLTAGTIYKHPTTSVLGNAAATSFLALMYRHQCSTDISCPNYGITMDELFWFAKGQVDYILGRNHFSYMIGFGSAYPKQAYHKAASCPTNLSTSCSTTDRGRNAANPNVLKGGVVNGPKITGAGTESFSDLREQYEYTGVTSYTSGAVMAALPALVVQFSGCTNHGQQPGPICCIGLISCQRDFNGDGQVTTQCLPQNVCSGVNPPAPTPAPAPATCYQCWNNPPGSDCTYWCPRAFNEGCGAVGCTKQECSFCL
jgi:endoglucanase